MKLKYIAVLIAGIALTGVMAEAKGNGNGEGKGKGKQQQEQKKSCETCKDAEGCTQTAEQNKACQQKQAKKQQKKKSCGSCSK